MFTHTKRLFQLSLITLFTTLFFLGAMGVNSAFADHDFFEGKIKLKITCFNSEGKPTKEKIKTPFTMWINPDDLNPSVPDGEILPFSFWTSVFINIPGLDEFLGVPGGVALSKNNKKGTFQAFLENAGGTRLLSINGTLVAGKDGNSKKITGKVKGSDILFGCIYDGKFKAKFVKFVLIEM